MDDRAVNVPPEWIHDRASRLMDGSLSPTEERELGEALRTSREARRIMASYVRLEGAITQLARAEQITQSGSAEPRKAFGRRSRIIPRVSDSPVPARSRRAAWAAGGLAAAGLIGLLYVSARLPSPPAAPPLGFAPRSASPAAPPDLGVPGRAEGPSAVPDAGAQPTPEPRPTAPGLRSERLPEPPAAGPPLPADPVPGTPGTETAEASPRPSSAAGELIATEVTLEHVEGDVVLTGPGGSRRARSGDPVAAGQGVQTGPEKALAVLAFPDGTRLEARAASVIRDVRQGGGATAPDGKYLFLQRGSVWAHVRPQPGDRPFVLGTPRGEARILGTIMTLRVDPDPRGLVRVDVQDGRVRFTRSQDGRSVDVPAGHSASAFSGSELTLLRSTDSIVSFQDGVAPTPEYAGTRDTQISEKNPQGNFGHSKSLVAEGEEGRGKHRAQWPLLRWDLSAVPPGSRIRSASISLYVTEPSHGFAFYLYEAGRVWTETEATWRLASAGAPWRLPGSIGSPERWGLPSGSLTPLVRGEYTAELNETGIALVQSWVNAPATNVGFVIASAEPAPGFHFNSRRAPGAETRPKLTVVYLPRR